MSDQREMTLDEYLESKLPDFHLARRQLQELREESDALAAHVAVCHALMEEMPRRSLAWQVNAMVDLKAEAPEASLTRLKAECWKEAYLAGMEYGHHWTVEGGYVPSDEEAAEDYVADRQAEEDV